MHMMCIKKILTIREGHELKSFRFSFVLLTKRKTLGLPWKKLGPYNLKVRYELPARPGLGGGSPDGGGS